MNGDLSITFVLTLPSPDGPTILTQGKPGKVKQVKKKARILKGQKGKP